MLARETVLPEARAGRGQGGSASIFARRAMLLSLAVYSHSAACLPVPGPRGETNLYIPARMKMRAGVPTHAGSPLHASI